MMQRRLLLQSSAAFSAFRGSTAPARAASPLRLVCVGSALTEIVYVLQAHSLLVGVDTTSNYPAEARNLAQVGYARTLSIEGILALRPDHVLVTEEAGPPSVLTQLGAAGIALHRLPSNRSFEGLCARVSAIGQLTQRTAAAARLLEVLRASWKKKPPPQSLAAKVMFILGHTPNQLLVSGLATQADAVIGFAGAHNAITAYRGYKPLSSEAMVLAQPDVLLITTQGLQTAGGEAALRRIPGLAYTPAGGTGRIITMEAVLLLGFGPRLPDAVQQLARGIARAVAL